MNWAESGAASQGKLNINCLFLKFAVKSLLLLFLHLISEKDLQNLLHCDIEAVMWFSLQV